MVYITAAVPGGDRCLSEIHTDPEERKRARSVATAATRRRCCYRGLLRAECYYTAHADFLFLLCRLLNTAHRRRTRRAEPPPPGANIGGRKYRPEKKTGGKPTVQMSAMEPTQWLVLAPWGWYHERCGTANLSWFLPTASKPRRQRHAQAL